MKRNKKSMMLLILLLLVLSISVGYAALNTTLNITGNTIIKSTSWNVRFKAGSANVASGSVSADAPVITDKKVTFNPTLSKPGEYYEFTVVVENVGGLDAKVSANPQITGLTDAQKKYTDVVVTYSDDNVISVGDSLENTTGTATYKVVVKYKDDIDASELPTEEQNMNIEFNVNYVQA